MEGILFVIFVVIFLLWIYKKEHELFGRYNYCKPKMLVDYIFKRKKEKLISKIENIINNYKEKWNTPYTDYQVDLLNSLENFKNIIKNYNSQQDILNLLTDIEYTQLYHKSAINDIINLYNEIFN